MPTTKRNFGLPRCNDSPNKTITRDVLSPNGFTVIGQQVKESTPRGEHRAFHNIAPGNASVDELKVLMADNRQADKNARKTANKDARRRSLFQVSSTFPTFTT
jgi:hypothetical protein